ncbi:hypothetical protein E4S40_14900 [Algoriphagus kandeliae]|uniref:Uncharacterized protein n=1 Tax=Algoriphagus kandeliae TaxID=2562278 RepID=A0A4Y9QPM0_9BACT|nr:hypothetical protein [Algoriphagus kandeliae]TFV93532.1 hypothetical protein E4S40_14900 [Algoriphagus kandeliae]
MWRTIFKNLTRRQLILVRLLLMSNSAVLLGAYFKINGNPNGEMLLIIGILLNFIGVFGLTNKWSKGGPL